MSDWRILLAPDPWTWYIGTEGGAGRCNLGRHENGSWYVAVRLFGRWHRRLVRPEPG